MIQNHGPIYDEIERTFFFLGDGHNFLKFRDFIIKKLGLWAAVNFCPIIPNTLKMVQYYE